MGRRRKKKKPYSLEDYEEGDERIGSLTGQGISIKIKIEDVRTNTNTSTD